MKTNYLLVLFALLLAIPQAADAKKKKDIAIQLYSVRDIINNGTDLNVVLKNLAQMGYTSIEAANYDNGKFYGKTPEEFKNAVVNPGIGVPKTMKEMKMYCDYFNEIGKRCQQNSMKFGYHNHAHEFQKVENQVVMLDYMIENTNPEYVFFQMDVYWIVRGQHSPVDYFNKYPGRFTVLHIKDDKEIGDSGMVGFDAIFRNAKVAGVKHIVAEIEGYSCPVEESVKKSLDYLLDAPFVKASYSK